MRGFGALSSKVRGLRVIACAAQVMAWVAHGKLSGYYSYDLNAWDVAAGTFLVQQAGGIVTDFSGGKNFVFGGELIAGCGMQPKMLEVIKTEWNK